MMAKVYEAELNDFLDVAKQTVAQAKEKKGKFLASCFSHIFFMVFYFSTTNIVILNSLSFEKCIGSKKRNRLVNLQLFLI